VDVSSVIPDLTIRSALAAKDNYLSRLLEPDTKASERKPTFKKSQILLDIDTANRLYAANVELKSQGLTLALLGGYAPQSVRYSLFNAVGDPDIVPSPEIWNAQAQGTCVEVTLLDASGNELLFPTAVYAHSKAAHRPYTTADATRRENASRLQNAMVAAGFEAVEENWWQFVDPDRDLMPINILPDALVAKAMPNPFIAASESPVEP
jgi:D-alanyl-D-alanine dipeptidase